MRLSGKKFQEPTQQISRPISRASDLGLISELGESNAVHFFELPSIVRPSSKGGIFPLERENKWKLKQNAALLGLETLKKYPIDVCEKLSDSDK